MADISHLRCVLVMGASALALTTMAAPFTAQAAAPSAPTAATPVIGDQGGEVIVVAEKRQTLAKKAPVAVSAFSARQRNIQGINTIQDLTNFTPGFTFSTQFDRAALRGIGRLSDALSADSAVAVYNDELYSTSTYLVGLDDLFIDRVEIDRGPQGTLYGRNAIGGLINTVSKYPTDHLTGEARVEYGNYNHANVEATVSGPVAPNLNARLSGYYTNQDQGYFKNVAGGPSEGGVVHDWYINGMAEWRPTDKDDIWFDAYGYAFNNDRGGLGSLLGTPTLGLYDTAEDANDASALFNPNFGYAHFTGFNPLTGTANGPIPGSVVGIPPGFSQNPALTNIRDFAHAIPTSVNANGDLAFNFHYIHHFDGFDMKYVGGYSQYNATLTTNLYDTGNSSVTSYQIPLLPSVFGGMCASQTAFGPCGPLTVHPSELFTYVQHNNWTSHEITFSSTNDAPLQWIAGFFFYDQHYDSPISGSLPGQAQLATPYYPAPFSVAPTALNPFGLPSAPANPHRNFYQTDYTMENRSYAGYGQLDWKVTDTIKLTGGLRFTYDTKSGTEEYRQFLFSDELAGGNATLHLPPGLLTAENLGDRFPALDLTGALLQGVMGKRYKGVTCLPHPLANGEYQRCLGDSSNALTGTAGIEWTPDRDTLAYLRYNRGYKALGFNAGTISSTPEAAPEFVDDFEAGIKQSIGSTFQYNVDAFYYNYSNAQVPIDVFNGGLVASEFINIPKAISTGVEVQAIWEPIPRLVLNLTYAFDYTNIQSGCHATSATSGVGTCFVDAIDPGAKARGAKRVFMIPGTLEYAQSLQGNRLPQAPENKVAFNATYTWEFEPGNFSLSGTFIWKDKSYESVNTRWYYSAPPWNEVDLRAVWSGDHDRYEIVGFVKNAFNTLGYDAAASGYGTEIPNTQVSAFDLTPPRTYGVELHYRFF